MNNPPITSRVRAWSRKTALAAGGLPLMITLLVLFARTSPGQAPPEFLSIQRLANREVLLSLEAPAGLTYRLDAATSLPDWQPLLTLQSTGLNVHADTAAAYLSQRFYRAQQVTDNTVLTGDHLATAQGDVVFHPINHASLVMTWNGKTIYNDPVGGPAPYAGLPRADLILVSHIHSDHFHSGTLDAVRGSNCVLLAPQAVYSSLPMTPTNLRAMTIVMTNGASAQVAGITVDAIPAYNSNHPLGTGNGYILNLGGKRIYFTGDTGNIPEMRALRDIDVAFVCINVPYTMTVTEATNAVRNFRPKVVYPYHYRDQSGATTNAAAFKQWLGSDLGIEVRLRKWY
jgi:L-ascorbate metabolism protein UlaG (beta-lactamase superfamily)